MKAGLTTLIWTILLGVNVIALVLIGHLAFRSQALGDLAAETENHLTLFVSSLDGRLEKYEYLPSLLANDHRLVAALRAPEPTRTRDANRFLEAVADTVGASDVYLMDAVGTTVAASNWNLDRSFVDRNFSFRPYFRQAMEGGLGRYFALGTTSNQRGYYYAYPVTYDREIRGAVVVKVDLDQIEQNWATQGKDVMVTDEDGVVFLTTRSEWLFASMQSLSAADATRIRESRRYADTALGRLRVTWLKSIDDEARQVLIQSGERRGGRPFLMVSREMPKAGWTVHMVADTRIARESALQRTALAGLGMLIVLLLVILYLVNRQRQRALVFARDELEHRVEQRTAELRSEVDERRRAESELRDTQAELIHAAKMAGLGQMSAGISHELNQPLTAIRSYADNAARMLARERYDALGGNLGQIRELTDRMAGIIGQLRGFSRKSRGERKSVPVRDAVNQALELFRRDIEHHAIEVTNGVDEEAIVDTDPLLLNQVLVNLLSNAIHAVSGRDPRHIEIVAGTVDGVVWIRVSDNGPGIDDEVAANMFDPFFTTKEVGLGLGLGLSISYRIMESLGGSIRADNAAGGGAQFTIELPVPTDSRDPHTTPTPPPTEPSP